VILPGRRGVYRGLPCGLFAFGTLPVQKSGVVHGLPGPRAEPCDEAGVDRTDLLPPGAGLR